MGAQSPANREDSFVFRRPEFRHAATRPGPSTIALVAIVLTAAAMVVSSLVGVDIQASSATTIGTGSCASTISGGLTTETKDLKQAWEAAPWCRIAFTAGSGTWTVPAGVTSVEVLVFGGGGGGGNFGGGGGGEGIVKSPKIEFLGSAYPVTSGAELNVSIGAGGTGGLWDTPPTSGGDSVFGTLTAKGGGYGGSTKPDGTETTPGAAGGSGGGGAPMPTGGTANASAGGAAGTPSTDGYVRAGGAGNGNTYPSGAGTARIMVGGGGGGAYPKDLLSDPEMSGRATATEMWPGSAWPGYMAMVIADDLLTAPSIDGFGSGGAGGAIADGVPKTIGYTGPEYGARGGIKAFTNASTSGSSAEPNSAGGGGGGGIDFVTAGGNGGSGFIIVAYQLGAVAGVPGAPTEVTGAPGTGQVEVAWSPPASDGGSEITDYAVEQSTDGGTTWTTAPMCSGTELACTVTGVTNGTGYVFRVAATNVNGTGPWSEPSATVTPGVGPAFTG